MGIATGILVSVAASAIFYLLQNFLLEWPYPWDIVSTGVVLVITTTLAIILNPSRAKGTSGGTSVMSKIETKKDMKAKIDNLETSNAQIDILTQIKTGGSADFEIKDTKI